METSGQNLNPSAAKNTGVNSSKIQQIINKLAVIFHLVEKLFKKDEKNKKISLTRLISGGEELVLEGSDDGCISNSKDVFTAGVNPIFKELSLNQPSKKKEKTFAEVREIVHDGTPIQVFSDINFDLEKIILTQSQIVQFCKKHFKWLCHDGGATLFLMEVDKEYKAFGKVFREYMVVEVQASYKGLCVLAYPLDLAGNLEGGLYRVVTPKFL